MPRLFSLISMMLFLLMATMTAQADGFGINATRLIYPQGADSITVAVRNTRTDIPYLVQVSVSRIQEGNEPSSFIVRPPLFRLEPSTTSQIRISALAAELPNDRESIFYFHAKAIPASKAPKHNEQFSGVGGAVQFGVGNIIKVFYRPNNLAYSSVEAQKKLQFSQAKGGIKVSNPSPYFVSFSGIKIDKKPISLNTPEARMLAPFGSYTYVSTVTKGIVDWRTINDEGGINAFTYDLQ